MPSEDYPNTLSIEFNKSIKFGATLDDIYEALGKLGIESITENLINEAEIIIENLRKIIEETWNKKVNYPPYSAIDGFGRMGAIAVERGVTSLVNLLLLNLANVAGYYHKSEFGEKKRPEYKSPRRKITKQLNKYGVAFGNWPDLSIIALSHIIVLGSLASKYDLKKSIKDTFFYLQRLEEIMGNEAIRESSDPDVFGWVILWMPSDKIDRRDIMKFLRTYSTFKKQSSSRRARENN